MERLRQKIIAMLVAVIIASLCPPSVFAQDAVSFITCPIYRDTDNGRKSGCWLADNPETGNRYDISLSPNRPDWNYGILVEGLTSNETREQKAETIKACGAPLLEPVRVSILYSHKCTRHSLPPMEFTGHKFVLPKTIVMPMNVDREIPVGPFENTTFHLFYDFDRDFTLYQYSDHLFDEAAYWLLAANPEKIIVTGYAVTEPLRVSGTALRERPVLSRRRAERTREALIRMGINADKIEIRTRENPNPVAGKKILQIQSENSRRRVDIVAQF